MTGGVAFIGSTVSAFGCGVGAGVVVACGIATIGGGTLAETSLVAVEALGAGVTRDAA